jgi:hypothetical protein
VGRAIGGVITAFVVWTMLWLGFNQIAAVVLPGIIVPEEPLTHTGMLITFIMYSAVISIVAGFVCASVKKESPMKTVWVFALIQLAVGIFVEYTYWDLMPAWYHIVFLALIVPATVWGGSQKKDDSAATA